MSITKVTPPRRKTGAPSRLSDNDYQQLAEHVRQGEWASDDQPVPSKSCAYQRAQSAVKVLDERYEFSAVQIKTTVYPVDVDNPDTKFMWAIGPRPNGERMRQPRKASSDGTIEHDRSQPEYGGSQDAQ